MGKEGAGVTSERVFTIPAFGKLALALATFSLSGVSSASERFVFLPGLSNLTIDIPDGYSIASVPIFEYAAYKITNRNNEALGFIFLTTSAYSEDLNNASFEKTSHRFPMTWEKMPRGRLFSGRMQFKLDSIPIEFIQVDYNADNYEDLRAVMAIIYSLK